MIFHNLTSDCPKPRLNFAKIKFRLSTHAYIPLLTEVRQKRLSDTRAVLLSKLKNALRLENGAVFKSMVANALKLKRQQAIEAARAAGGAAPAAPEEPRGVIGRLFG